MACSCAAFAVVMVISVLTSFVKAEGTLSMYNNCSHRYELRVGEHGNGEDIYCQGTCMDVSPPFVNTESCLSLQAILRLHTSVVTAGDCLGLTIYPGDYLLSSFFQARVNYSVVITAPEGGVSFSCASSSADVNCTSDSGGGDAIISMVVFEGRASDHVFVRIDGVNFRNCSKQLQFDELEDLSIINCQFLGLTGSALDLFNVQNTLIQSSSFQDCISSNSTARFRANSGAVSIAYYRPETPILNVSNPSLNINDCSFISNSASFYNFAEDETGNVAFSNFYHGRGGGLSVVPQGYYVRVTGKITNTTFQNNRADRFGGAVLLLFSGTGNYHNFSLEDCKFLDNSATYGGGLQIAFLLSNLDTFPTMVTVVRCHFEGNHAEYGGGLGAIQVYSQGKGNLIAVEDSHFVRNQAENAGSAVMCQTFAYVQSRHTSYSYNFSDCSFTKNVSPGGAFGAGFININFFGTLSFTSNVGPALRLVGSLVSVDGRLSFMRNSIPINEMGGALYIQSFGQIKLLEGAELEFINNTGSIGSAIVVDVQRSSPVFSELVFNPQCFLINENTILPPQNWSNVSIHFSGNVASIGPVVYISHLLHCSWFESLPVQVNESNAIRTVFSLENFTQWRVFDYEMDNRATSSVDPLDPNAYIQTQPATLARGNNSVEIYPGESVPLDLSGMDQLMNPTYVIARVSDGRSNINSGAFTRAGGTEEEGNITVNINEDNIRAIRFVPSLLPIQPNKGVTNIRFGFTIQSDSTSMADEVAQDLAMNLTERRTIPVVIDTPFDIIESANLHFNITLTSCLPGYRLTRTNNLYTCQCVDDEFEILNCEEDLIVLRDGTWVGVEKEPIPHLDATVCPAPYCRCYSSSNKQLCESLYYQDNIEGSNQQCHPTRKGTLCGGCVNDTGVGLLRTNCRSCEGESFYSIGFLVVWDIFIVSLLMVLVIKLDFSFPSSLKGLLFYIQTVYYVTEYFPSSFWDARKYMLYFSSFVSLYFPYDFCLFPGMTALVSYAPKFIPPIIAVIIVTVVTIGAYAMRARNGRKNAWRGMWTLTLLLYAPLVHTCVSLMKCPKIPGDNGEDEDLHWFYDGEVVCFKDPGHIVLFLIALVVLIILILLIPITFIIAIIGTLKDIKNHSLTTEWIVSALTEGYRDSLEARWWASWELLRRLLLISIVVALPGRSVTSLFIIITAFTMHVFFKPYREVYQNIIEACVLLNYILLLLVRSTQTFLDNTSSFGYTGTDIPDYLGNELPSMDRDIWLFVPFFYLIPILILLVFLSGTVVYYIIRLWKKRMRRDSSKDISTVFSGERNRSHYRQYSRRDVTTTEVGMDWEMVDQNH